jgi:hypothetical protein
VPGRAIGMSEDPQTGFPILLVVSCGPPDPNLYFVDPRSLPEQNRRDPPDPAGLVKTIATSPSFTWVSLAWRGSELLACTFTDRGNQRTDFIYAIDINPANAIPDGTARFLFHRPNGDSCAIAWDPDRDAISQT